MTDFTGDARHMDEFTEHHLRCMSGRDARFVGKMLAHVDRVYPGGKVDVEIYVTLAGTYVTWFSFLRKNGSSSSKHGICLEGDEISDFFGTEGFRELGKLAMIEAGIDDAVDIP